MVPGFLGHCGDTYVAELMVDGKLAADKSLLYLPLHFHGHSCDISDGEGCRSCEDCMCSAGQPYTGVASEIPGFIYAVRFDEGSQVSARGYRHVLCEWSHTSSWINMHFEGWKVAIMTCLPQEICGYLIQVSRDP